MSRVGILDATLRDGEQMPGVVFTKEEKIELAKMMSDFGVGIIDMMPAVSDSERETTEYLSNCGLKSQIIASTMMNKDHIDIAKDCGVQRIALITSLSDIHLDKKMHISKEKNLERSLKYVEYANELGLRVDFAGEDSTRADLNYLIDFINHLNVDHFFPCDTMGVLTPIKTYKFIKTLKRETDCKIGLHIHNDFGQATANTLAGIEAGADLFSGTFNGIGERAGNAPIEEVVLALKNQYGKTLDLKYEKLYDICRRVEEYSFVKLQKHKPISGENAFSHESGMHVDGLVKYSGNYENYDPSIIGRERRILYGKHSGVNSLKYLFNGGKSDERCKEILLDLKSKSMLEKKSFSAEEVLDMYK